MPRFDGLLDRIISPKSLLAGVVIGLAACATPATPPATRTASRTSSGFEEETDYRSNYQTSAQSGVQSLLRETVRPDQIVVVVAGNSVMLGSGQSTEGVWTRHLQAELGDKFKVVNLALPGLAPTEFGTVAAEMFFKDGHTRMIVLTSVWVDPLSAIGEPDGRPILRVVLPGCGRCWACYSITPERERPTGPAT